MPPLPEASERPLPPPLTQMTRPTTRGTGVAAASSRRTPVERGPQQMSGPTKHVRHIGLWKTGDDGSFRHRGQCLSGEPMPTQEPESVKGVVAQTQDSVRVRRGTEVASEDDSKGQHLRNSFNILKRWRTGRWSKAPGNEHLFRLGGIPFAVIAAVVEWSSSRPLDCGVRGSNPGQGRNLKTKISASGAPQRW